MLERLFVILLVFVSIVEDQKENLRPDTYNDLVEELDEIKRHAIA